MASYVVNITLQGTDNLSATLKNVNKELKGLNNSGEEAKSGFDKLKGAVADFAAAISVQMVAQKAVELYNLGTAANNAENTFVQLTGSTAAAGAALEAMRRATGGVVDDMTLMQGANKLLLMNLAGTGEEAAKLTEIAVKLGQAMGNDAATSIGDFAALLANQSIPRLDNFGISSDAVRRKVEELKKAGMDAQAAFSMAVMEEGAKSLDKLGASAETSGGAVQRMITNIGNAMQDFAQRFGTGVNGLAGIIEISLGMNPDQIAASNASVDKYIGNFSTIYDRITSGAFGGKGNDFMRQVVLEGLMALSADPALASDATALGQAIHDSMMSKNIWNQDDYANAVKDTPLWSLNAESGLTQIAGLVTMLNDEQEQTKQNAADIEARNQRIAAQAAAITAEQNQLNIAKNRERFLTAEIAAQSDAAFAATRRQADAQTELVNGQYEISQNLMKSFRLAGIDSQSSDAMSAVMGIMSKQDIASMMPDYMNRDFAEGIRKQYEDAAAELERLKELSKDGLVTDAQVEASAVMTSNLKGMADEAARAADAFDRIKLSELFGQSDGGLQGQVTDAVIQKMRDNGAKPELIQAMQDALDMQSGRQTGASQFFDKNIVPAMAGMKPEEAALLNQAYTDMMKQGGLAGLDSQGILLAQQKFMQTMFSGQGAGGGQAFTVKPGDTVSGLAMQYGMTPDQIMAGAGISNPRLLQPGDYATSGGGGVFDPTALKGFDPLSIIGTIAPDMQQTADNLKTIGEDTTVFTEQLTVATEQSSGLKDNIQSLAEKTNTVRIELKLTGEDWEKLKKMGLLDTALSGGVRDNGGIVRGRDARVAE